MSQNDTNGVLYWLGTMKGQAPFSNPVTSSCIKVTSSLQSFYGTTDGSSTFGGRQQASGGLCNNGGSWFQVELPLAVCAMPFCCRKIQQQLTCLRAISYACKTSLRSMVGVANRETGRLKALLMAQGGPPFEFILMRQHCETLHSVSFFFIIA